MYEIETVLQNAHQLHQEGQTGEALAALQQAAEEFPDHPALWSCYGLLCRHEQRLDESVAALEHASLLAPLSPEAQYALACGYRQQGRTDLAEMMFEFLSQLDDLPIELMPAVAVALGGFRDYHGALRVCRRAAQQHPELDEPLYGIAFYLGKLNYPVEAILPVMWRAFELDSSCVLYRTTLATLLSRAGQHREAYDLLKVFSTGDLATICCPTALRQFTVIFQLGGDPERADACIRRLEQVNPACKRRCDGDRS